MAPSIDEKELAALARAAAAGTPAYAYLGGRIDRRAARLREGLPPSVRVLYSIKANPEPPVLARMRALGLGADAASAAEMDLARAAGFAGAQVSLMGPGKSDDELRTAAGRGHVIVAESVGEIDRLARFGAADVMLRVSPSSYVGASGRPVDSRGSQFGLDEDDLPAAFAALGRAPRLNPRGVHVFTQSQFLEARHLIENWHRAFALVARLNEKFGRALPGLNLGGGFGLPYFEGQTELDVRNLKPALEAMVAAHTARFGALDVAVESGRYLAGDAGFYLTRVLERKISRGKTYLIVDGGLHQHQAAAGLGQLVRRNYPVIVLGKTEDRETVTVAGATCYSADLLAQDLELPKAVPGDVLCIGYSGAYGANFSPVNFLSRPPPRQVFIADPA